MKENLDDNKVIEAFRIENGRSDGYLQDTGLKDKWVSPTENRRKNLLITACICWSIWILGWTYGQLGTAFPDLQQILKVSLRKASLIFTMNSVGYLTGAFVFGVIYDQVGNAFIILSLLAVGVAITTVILPWCTTYGLFLAVRIVGGLCCGGIDSTGNAKLVSCWGKDVRQYMQMLHFSCAFGGIIAPLVTSPFLSQRQTDTANVSKNGGNQLVVEFNMTGIVTEIQKNSSGTYNFSNSVSVEDREDIVYEETRVHYAFMISGVLTLIITFAFVWLKCLGYEKIADDNKRHTKQTDVSELTIRKKYPKMTLRQKVFVLVNLSVFVCLYGSVECKMVSFAMPFVLLQLNWTKQYGAILISVLWATFAAGRFGGIFISRFLRPTNMIILFLMAMMASVIGILIGGLKKADVLIWLFIPMTGASMSVIFPTLIVWVNEHLMKVTGKMSALFNAFGSVGFMIGPLYVGYLMDNVSTMWLVYAQIVEIVLCLSVFMVLVCAVKIIKRVDQNQKLAKVKVIKF